MDNENRSSRDYFIVDFKHVFDALWKRVWLIVLTSLLTAAIGFSMAAFVVAPKYASDIMLYVNNRDISVGGLNISASDLNAAQSLVKTYIVILNNRTTLEAVIEQAQVPYTYEELADMIEATAVNNTEVMRVTVTSKDPYEAAKIANTIAEVFPLRISEIIEGSSMEVVDAGVPNLDKVSPGVAKYTVLGFMGGFVLIVAILTVAAIMDDTIHDEDYIVTNYQYPLLAVVPDLTDDRSGEYSYYAHSNHGKRRAQ